MIDLFGEMTKNRNEIIKLVEEKNQFEISFDTIDEYDIPYIIIRDEYDMLVELCITKAKFQINEKKEYYIDFFASDTEEWIDEDDALSTTANNVYNTIYQILTN